MATVRRSARTLAALTAATALLGGCAGAPPLPRHAGQETGFCLTALERIDRAVAREGVADGGAQRLAGFPWLRLTRPLASFRDEVAGDAEFSAWLSRLSRTAAAARAHELANLPPPAYRRLAQGWQDLAPAADVPGDLSAGIAACRRHLNGLLEETPAARERLRQTAHAEDAYSTWQRAIGLYPLLRWFMLPRIAAYQSERAAVFGGEAPASLQRFAAPPAGSQALIHPTQQIPRDALDIPQPDTETARRLLDAHAPVWAVEVESSADLPGALVLDSRGRPLTDVTRPTEYRRLSWTRFRGQVLLQLNYVLWFPARPRTGPLDLYGGHLDAVVWRVTLHESGEVLAYDSMHACGCYYTLFPGPDWQVRDTPPGTEPVASPAKAPLPAPGERVVVHLEPGTHYLAGLGTGPGSGAATPLVTAPLDELRSLPLPGGGQASAFAPSGLIPSSARLERFLLWPYGVPSAGAMRQWGTHAIAFVGRRHFDDPFLLERLLTRESEP